VLHDDGFGRKARRHLSAADVSIKPAVHAPGLFEEIRPDARTTNTYFGGPE
jgi:hypothetical protein